MIFYFLILILFVYNNQIVFSGATYGLMLWYRNIIPLLLPFILISSLIVNSISKKNNPRAAVSSVILLGAFCGYPVGAKTAAEYTKKGIIAPALGNIIIPLCNNSSPMFISGYVTHNILKNSVSFFKILCIIYVPYILITFISLIICRSKLKTQSTSFEATSFKTAFPGNTDIVLDSVISICYVGIYIIMCSIFIQFIANIPLPHEYSLYIAGATEITRGIYDIYNESILPAKIKTALIIAITSFGGASSILQTNKVISNSGLSIVYYTLIKLVCSVISFYLGILLI